MKFQKPTINIKNLDRSNSTCRITGDCFTLVWGGLPIFNSGHDYKIASVLLTVLILSATLELASSPLRPFLYVADSAGISLAIQIFGTIAYIGIFYVGVETLNLLTPGIASLTLNISTLVLASTAIFMSRIKRENRASS